MSMKDRFSDEKLKIYAPFDLHSQKNEAKGPPIIHEDS